MATETVPFITDLAEHGAGGLVCTTEAAAALVEEDLDVDLEALAAELTDRLTASKGAPELSKLSNRGDQFVTVKVNIPKTLTDEEKGIIEQLDSVSAPAS